MTGDYRVVVLASGRGSNLGALLQKPDARYRVVGVVCNRPDAAALTRAREHAVASQCIDHRDYADREAFDAALAQCVASLRPDLVVLAGFMRILTPTFIQAFAGRLINLHPSLLPRHRGLETHRRALEAGDTEHGASVHFVTADLDAGPVIMQAHLPIEPHDDAASLAQRLLPLEHQLLVACVELLARGSVEWHNGQVLVGEKLLTVPLRLEIAEGIACDSPG